MLNILKEKRNKIINKKKIYEIKIKKLVDELKIIDNSLNKLCYHKWVTDYIDKPYSEGSEKITYCEFCYLNKM